MSAPAPHQGPNGNNWREYIEWLIRRGISMAQNALAQIAALTVIVNGLGATNKFAEFFGLTAGTGQDPAPTDYPATIAPKTVAGSGRVPFPQNGPTSGGVGAITRINPSSFTLPDIGFYKVTATIHTTEPGQLQLELNGADLAYTLAPNQNPTSGGHVHVISAIVQTTLVNEILAVINPQGNPVALTIPPPDASSTHANAQTLVIQRIG